MTDAVLVAVVLVVMVGIANYHLDVLWIWELFYLAIGILCVVVVILAVGSVFT